MMKWYLPALLLFLLLVNSVVFAQEDHLPFISPVHNFSQKEYNAGTQNWGISQDKYGIIYIANNQGLLTFDGNLWELHLLPNKRIVRSVFIDDNRIYVGSFEEFGYFQRSEKNELIYKSLKNKIPDYKFQNDEIWRIFKHQNNIYFQTFSSYFVFDGQNVKNFNPKPAPFGLYSSEKSIYMQGIDDDFYQLTNKNELIPIIRQTSVNNDLIINTIPHKENLILVTIQSGLFIYNLENKTIEPFKTDFDSKLKKSSLNRALKTDNSLILGSLNDGVFAIDIENGKGLWHMNKSNGLQNNTILGLFEDKQKNIWIALDNGISYIDTQSKLSYFNLKSDIDLVEDMTSFQGNFYMASNKGIYFIKDNEVKKIPNFDEQVWFVKNIDNQLFIGHNKGSANITNNTIQPIENVGVGGTDLKKGIIHGKEVLIGSSYTFLSVYKKNPEGKWLFSHNIEDFSDLIQCIEIDYAGNIWANHTYKGIYKIELNEDLTKIKSKKLYKNLGNDKNLQTLKLLKFRGKPIFTDTQQFYQYNEEGQEMIPYNSLNENLPNLTKTQKIIPINDNLFWFITNKDYFLVSYKSTHYKIEDKISFKNIIKPSNEERATIFVNKQGESFFCLNESIAKYSPKNTKVNYPYKLSLKSLSNYNRKSDDFSLENIGENLSIDYQRNNLIFDFQFPNFSKETLTLMYRLENYDKRWNLATPNFTVDYQNLPQGEYVLNAKIINELGNDISHLKVPFKITTPWYKSVLAFIIYFCIGIGLLVYIIFLYFKFKLRKRERLFTREKAKKEQILKQQEQEITQLRNEKLEAELIHKSKIIAGTTMMNIKHDNFLENLIVDLNEFMKKHKISPSQSRPIMQHIRENISTEGNWQIFQENFDMIHKNFFKNLKKKYPNLTSSDLKLCVLIRLNYSTKEIAAIQGISIRGIETARYRLRKKLNLSEEDSLTNFLITFE
ncbi:triple tyrosine motif-containing protein [Capnocytophaga cynodegmi]